MATNYIQKPITHSKDAKPVFMIVALFVLTALELRLQGRSWWCSCGQLFLWAGDVWSSHNSQHFLDPYTFTHVAHGFLFCGLMAVCVPRLSLLWRLWLALLLEALWEIIENTDFVIQRYRETTAALGYYGDSIGNSLGDILACGLGFIIAERLGFRRTAVLFLVMELALVVWIKDSLILEILMLIYPIAAVKQWQLTG